MKLYWNKATGVLGLTPMAQSNVARLQAKRYMTLQVELIPVDATGEVELFADGATGLLVVKTTGDYDGASKLLDAAWDAPSEEGRGYVFDFLVAGEALDNVLGTLPKLALALEMVWNDDGDRGVSPTVELEVFNNYWREDDPPEAPEDPFPLPGDILVKGEQALSGAEQLQVRTNLGLATMLCRESVELPAGLDADAPEDFELAGSSGQFAFDESRSRLWIYIGAQWHFTTLISG